MITFKTKSYDKERELTVDVSLEAYNALKPRQYTFTIGDSTIVLSHNQAVLLIGALGKMLTLEVS